MMRGSVQFVLIYIFRPRWWFDRRINCPEFCQQRVSGIFGQETDRRYLPKYPKYFCTARCEHKSSIKTFQTQKKTKTTFLGRSWAKIGLRKTKPNLNSKRRDSESSTDIDRQSQRLRNEIWTGRVRQGLPPTLRLQCSQNDR